MFWERRFPIVGIGPFVGPNLRPSQGEGLRGSWEAGRSLPVVLTLLISPFSLFFFFLPVTRSVPRGLATQRQRLVALEGCRLKLYEEEGEKMGHWEQLPATSNPAPALPLYCLGRNSAAEGKNRALFTHFSAPPARALSFSPGT